MKGKVYACLLAGGKGTRLWPLSTEKLSKSFIRIGDKKPLITNTIERVAGVTGRKNIVFVVDKAQDKTLRKFTKGIPSRNIIVEPFGRSTASAVGLAATELKPEDIMVVLPTDHLVSEPREFRKTIKEAVEFIRDKEDAMLCIGIKPRSASTAYGYIKIKDRQRGKVYSVDKFIEKPNEKVAKRLVKRGDHFWNAGMFIFKVKTILEAIRKHAPLLHKELAIIKRDKRSMPVAYLRMKNVSIDYQIMERAKNLYCIKGYFAWSDLGSWKSVESLFDKDKSGNISVGKVKLVDTRNSIVFNTEKKKIGVVGLNDMVVVNTKNGTLSCTKEEAEKVKRLSE